MINLNGSFIKKIVIVVFSIAMFVPAMSSAEVNCAPLSSLLAKSQIDQNNPVQFICSNSGNTVTNLSVNYYVNPQRGQLVDIQTNCRGELATNQNCNFKANFIPKEKGMNKLQITANYYDDGLAAKDMVTVSTITE